MASRKLNVLVYTGTGSTAESVKHCLGSLRQLLSPNYAVIPIAETALLKEPWAPTCALLVVPGGADMGYCRVLNGVGNRIISQFVRRGGAYLGFCAGGYYGSQRCEFEVGNQELEVTGPRELAFFPGTCRGATFKGFAYHSERGTKAAKILVKKDAFPDACVLSDVFSCYYNGGGVFVGADKMAENGVRVLAEYADDVDVESGDVKAAVVYCKVGDGAAILTGPHPEFAAANLHKQPDLPGYDSLLEKLAADDDARNNFLKACLTELGLEVSAEETASVPSLSRIHLSSFGYWEAEALMASFRDILTVEGGEEFIMDDNDLFHLEKPDSAWTMDDLTAVVAERYKSPKKNTTGRAGTPDPTAEYNHIPKRIVFHDHRWPGLLSRPYFKDGDWYGKHETPYFFHDKYYWTLDSIQNVQISQKAKWLSYKPYPNARPTWGRMIMYGEVVTSTNTLLERNPKLLSKLPTGFTLVATTQLAGRGRGTNVWVAPTGSLLWSTVINHPANLAASRPIVFIQYLAAIAIVEAVKNFNEYRAADWARIPIKLKWPNDIYAQDPTKPDDKNAYVKIGGILSNCVYSNGNYQIVLGVGLNTNNDKPTTSLSALLPLVSESGQELLMPNFPIEILLAKIMVHLEALYTEFCHTGWSQELLEKYYSYWLHSGQIVTLEDHGGTKARVVGITSDWGLLKVEEVVEDEKGELRTTGKMWALQSDENSFDFWKGLVRRKL
ncbi:biotin-protein ligase [Apodospora peruviana]|uniref:Biotin-protein ligase n=1 Tax=Apodospora peruviana TaxID=516989 RepID=A0AAE0I0V1_9PEZI|nr:biotin-protein ligase [Apodospora peruviana]